MASWDHEGIVELFRSDPSLAPELLREALGVEVPKYTTATVDTGSLTQLHPAELRADLVVRLESTSAGSDEAKTVMAVVLEPQTQKDPDKLFSWPAYLGALRHRLRCDVCLLVVTQSEGVANWASNPIRLGPAGWVQPLVLRPSAVPVIEDAEEARKGPELAVLSAMVHGSGSVETAVRVALAATAGAHALDRDRFMLYFDLIYRALSSAAKEAFRMDSQGARFFSEEFQQSYDRGLVAGKAAAVLDVLEARGLSVSDAQRERIISCTDLETLSRWHRSAITADSTDALFE